MDAVHDRRDPGEGSFGGLIVQEFPYEVPTPRWESPCLVVATGASLTHDVAIECMRSHCAIIAVKQAAHRLPEAPIMYALDDKLWFWDQYRGFPAFRGEKWTAGCRTFTPRMAPLVAKYGLHVIRGDMQPGFSTNPKLIHYGRNAGYQAINLAFHMLEGQRKTVILVGFDFTGGYFYGEHPRGRGTGYKWGDWVNNYQEAAERMPQGWTVLNANPKSGLKVFPRMTLTKALAG